MTTEEALAHYARTLTIGQHKKPCPACAGERKKKHDPSMSIAVYGDRLVYKCHHCELNGIVPFEDRQKVQMNNSIDSQRMKKLERKPLTEDALAWLSARGISEETAKKASLFSVTHYINAEGAKVPCVAFPYLVNGTERGAKIRSLSTKGFSCTNSLKSFFNIDAVSDDTLVICEGEMDALSVIESGFMSAVSVPNGAVAKVSDSKPDPEEDTTFSFLWEAKDLIENASKIVIACDADKQGQAMSEELARRIGKDRVWKIDWPEECKDANDVLVKHGSGFLEQLIEDARPWPVSGIYDAESFADEVKHIYKNGAGRGVSTGYPSVDELYTVAEGQLTVVTGNPSSGKSEFIDQIMMNQAIGHDMRFAVCSFENEPKFHIAKLMSKLTGKPFFQGVNERLSEEELDDALDFINKHFTFIHQADGSMATLDSILDRLKVAVMRHGIRGAVIDPYNYINRPSNVTETEWISEMLTRVRVFAQAHGIHIWFVAHPAKMQRENGRVPAPKGYDISGSAAWFAKADCGLTVHRSDPTSNTSEIIIWKIRFSWIGKQGETRLVFDRVTSRYDEPTAYSVRANNDSANEAPF